MPPRYSREISTPIAKGRCLKDQFRTSPCEDSCPAGNPIQKMQSLIEKGEFSEALRYLRAKNPFPGVTGRVCPHFCQQSCNRSHLDSCIAIRDLERAASDHAGKTPPMRRRPATGKKVAVIGGGPAGLTGAYFLSLLGHDATVFEAAPMLGGIPRYAIPGFRLPRDIVDREVGLVLQAGVHARVNTKVGRDISFSELRSTFDAVLVATGMPAERSLPIPHAEKALKAVEFLKNAALGLVQKVGRKVVVMGGGGVAFDCAFTARRLGAEEVHVICLEEAHAMRAPAEDIAQAEAEGIVIHNACTMSAIACADGDVTAAEFFEVESSSFDAAGRLTLTPRKDGGHVLGCDTVIFAVGMMTDLDFMGGGAALSPRRCLVTDGSMRTTNAAVFAAGEVASGPASVAQSVGQGRDAAFGIHALLTGEDSPVFALDDDDLLTARPDLAGNAPHVVQFEEMYGVSQYPLRSARPARKTSGVLDMQEIDPGMTREDAMQEASHCMHCGHCKGCGTCVDDCPGYVLTLESVPGSIDHPDQPVVSYRDECWHCANCRTSCPCGAIGFEFPLRMLV
ncbi:MAG: FAD-dependent oxidoreductase [Mailhella sp.]|nr:FAD-dependent oxidoreductase [Mailhella sp.]